MIKTQIEKKLALVLKKIGAPEEVIADLQPPANLTFGDYATGVALKLSKILKQDPMTIAASIKENFSDKSVEKIDVVKPGFVNFWVSKKYLLDNLKDLTEDKFTFPAFNLGPQKKVMVEFAHPNTLKLFHIGHLRNISTGESVVRILEAVGNKVVRSNYQGDVGLHIAKCLYGIRSSKFETRNLKTLQQKIEFIGKMYTEGTRAYEDESKAKEEIIKINKMIYDEDPEIMSLWNETRTWSLAYFDEVYKRLYSHFDRLYFESEFYKRGIEIVNESVKKGILEKSQGAIVFIGKKYGVDTRVFINSLGFPTYEGKELGLAEKEFTDFGELDKCIHVVTPEQKSFFKVTFKVEELLNPKMKGKQYHLAYNWVNLKEGKMSSRVGNVVAGPWLIDETKNKISKGFKCPEETAEILAVASVKYSFLKHSVDNAIAFDIDESIAIEGNSAPYLIYSYVRCQSVLKKEETVPENLNLKIINHDEAQLLRMLNQFSETVYKSASNFSPNLIANYLYELSSNFNLFYQKNPILKSENETKQLRLAITKATANTIKKGLELLGIKTVEKM